MQVHFETHREIDGRHYVDITIRGDRRTVPAGNVFNGWMPVYGLAVRFSTGTKVWPGSAVYWVESGNVNDLSPNIDRKGYVSLVGFIEDYTGKPVRSQHNAVA